MYVKYYLPDYMEGRGDAVELPKNYIGYSYEQMAELAAEHFNYHRGGWESEWPITFAIIVNDVEVGRYEVGCAAVPHFHATERK